MNAWIESAMMDDGITGVPGHEQNSDRDAAVAPFPPPGAQMCGSPVELFAASAEPSSSILIVTPSDVTKSFGER
jgi:hypothetical protein